MIRMQITYRYGTHLILITHHWNVQLEFSKLWANSERKSNNYIFNDVTTIYFWWIKNCWNTFHVRLPSRELFVRRFTRGMIQFHARNILSAIKNIWNFPIPNFIKKRIHHIVKYFRNCLFILACFVTTIFTISYSIYHLNYNWHPKHFVANYPFDRSFCIHTNMRMK